MRVFFSGHWEADLVGREQGVGPSRRRFLPEKRVGRQRILHSVG